MEALLRIDRLVVHHSASSRDKTTLEDIDRWHRDRGWDGVGYHWVIEADGAVRSGRPLPLQGAHARGHNDHTVAVCVVGNNVEDGEHWNDAQLRSLFYLIDATRLLFGPDLEVSGHRSLDGASTECPGRDVESL